MKLQKKFSSIYIRGNKLLTENLTPGKKFFNEELIHYKNKEYRVWNPKRSKLAAAIIKNCKEIGIKKASIVLYLGISHGYTASFISDIVGYDGMIFGVDISPRVMRDLIFLSYERKNITPILADANFPENYLPRISQADVIYQDIAQKNQTEILLKNLIFLKKNGYALIAVKARSIDVTEKPKKIFNMVKTQLEKKLQILDYKNLAPYQLDHCIFICKKF